MTVCIAAIYNKGIVAITDMQRTDMVSGQIHEAPVSKIYQFSPKIIALFAGDLSLQSELCEDATRILQERFPTDDFTVKTVLECFIDAHKEARQQRISINILGDYGLTWDEYKEGQKRRSGIVNDAILRRIESFVMPWGEDPFETIIAGIDEEGSHIWLVTPGDKRHCSDVAFAAIGSGALVADWEMKKALYSKHLPLHEATFVAFTAKARAEIFEGVGSPTVVSAINQETGFGVLSPSDLPLLYQQYNEMDDKIKITEMLARAERRVLDVIDNEKTNQQDRADEGVA